MTIDLVGHRTEVDVLIFGPRCGDGVGRDDPQAYALQASRVDIAGHLERHLCVGRMKAATVTVIEALAASDKNLPERPVKGRGSRV